jgi:hypothetical protein
VFGGGRVAAKVASRKGKVFPKLTQIVMGDLTNSSLYEDIITPHTPGNSTGTEPCKVLSDMATSAVDNPHLEHLTVFGSNPTEVNTAQAVLRTLERQIMNASHTSTRSELKHLDVQIYSPRYDPQYFWGPLSGILASRHCALECLRLAAEFNMDEHLQALFNAIRDDNNTLQSLVMTAYHSVDIAVLEALSSIFPASPELKCFHFDFPGISVPDQMRLFSNITTLEDIQIGLAQSVELAFYGLRNRTKHLLHDITSRRDRRDRRHIWQVFMEMMLVWFSSDAARRLSKACRHDIFLSGLWYAMTEYPILITELGVFDVRRLSDRPGISNN